MKAHIVIGANFGDEGKGQTVDYLCRRTSNNIVVRHNGGAQAAHTVVTEEGVRHVFHHFGSGTLAGTPTYLSKYFIANPRAFMEERIELMNLQIDPKVFCHRDALLTTPYDWFVNWMAEKERGFNKHGSCGMGINETVDRCSHEEYRTTVNDLYDIPALNEKLLRIATEYIPKRLDHHNILMNQPGRTLELARFEMISWDPFIQNCQEMRALIVPLSNDKIIRTYDNVIFEGAQGLLLDEHHHFFPYVTRSKTGVANAVQILKGLELVNGTKVDHADVYYVTRSYLSRHGAGPLPHEGEIQSFEDITNIPNEHQGTLRFAPLNIDLFKQSVSNDLISEEFLLAPHLVVTWAHLLGLPFIEDEKVQLGTVQDVYSRLEQTIPFNNTTLFLTPTAANPCTRNLRSV